LLERVDSSCAMRWAFALTLLDNSMSMSLRMQSYPDLLKGSYQGNYFDRKKEALVSIVLL